MLIVGDCVEAVFADLNRSGDFVGLADFELKAATPEIRVESLDAPDRRGRFLCRRDIR